MPDFVLRRFGFSDLERESRAPERSLDRLLDAKHGFAPPVDVYETPEAYELRVEIAGVDTSAVEVLVSEDGRTVTVSGERHASVPASRARYLNLEVQYGQFARRLALPEPVNREAASASYAEGFLVIRLPRLPGSPKRRVPVEGP